MASRRSTILLALGIFLLNAALNAPFFLPGEGQYRDSIEGGYASMARFISEHPDPFGWNPVQYFGLPTQMWYLPGVPYASALAIKLLPALYPEHVYRILVTSMACAVPATLFLFLCYFTRSTGWSLFTAVLYTLFSPSYAVFPAITGDRGITYLPWRIQVLVKYGEGPHNTGLALMPLALVAVWHAATRRRFWHLFAAAALLAAVALTNWIACMATAWCCLAMLATGWFTSREHGFSAKRMLLAAGLGYLLACFWLTPRFVQTTALNWPVDAHGYKLRLTQYLLLAALMAIPLIGLIVLRFRPAWHWQVFVTICFAGFLYVTGGHYWFGHSTIPESRRYALEAEMFFFVVLGGAVRFLLSHPNRLVRDALMIAAGALLVWYPVQARTYIRRTWERHQPTPREQTPEFRVSRFIDSRKPAGRVYAGGGTRFRMNSWFLLHQVGGTFESGLANRSALFFHYMARTGMGSPPERRAQDAIMLLRAAGVEYAVVHGPRSTEHWKDFVGPDTFEGVLPKVFEEGDDRVYQLPFHGFAHLVKGEEYPQSFPMNETAPILVPFLAAMDDPARRLKFEWLGNSHVRITGPIPEGMLVSTRMPFHPLWSATQDGTPLTIEADAMDLILLRPQPSSRTVIELHYSPPKQQIAGTAISALAWMGCIAAVIRERKRRGA